MNASPESPTAASSSGLLGGRAGARRTAIVAALLVGVGLMPALTAPMNSDVAWLLHVAERWTAGAELYVDLVETNPPLVVWLYAPAVWLGELPGLSTYGGFLLWIGAVLVGCLALATHLLRRLGAGREPEVRRLLLLLFVLGLFLLAGRSFGQKDHLAVALTLPYLLAVVARYRGEALARGPARLVGTLAAVGVCLKPHFLLLPAALETMRHLTCGEEGRWWRSETRVLAAGVVLYSVFVLIFAPEYLDVVERFGSLYAGHVELGLSELVSEPATLLLAVGWAAHGLVDESPERVPLTRAFLVGGTALLLAAALQLKGWSYHFLPALVLGAWAVGAVVVPSPSTPASGRLAGLGRIVAGGLFAALVTSAAWSIASIASERSEEEERLERVGERLSGCGCDDVLAVLSPRVGSAFPLVNRTGMRWGLRHHSQWALNVWIAAARRKEGPARRARSARSAWEAMRRETVDDLVARPPAWLLVDDRAAGIALGPDGPDFLAFYRNDPEFRELLAGYASTGRLAGYRLWRRNRPGEEADACGRGSERP